jgi:uncharacterized membrane protein YfcA
MTTPIFVMPIAFVCEYIDSSLGMGYGTSLTPLLLLLGFEPLQVVPAVLLSEFVSGITAASFHHSIQNVRFDRASIDTRVAVFLSVCALVGTVVSVCLTVRLPADVLKLLIGSIVLSMGLLMLITRNRPPRFRWSKIGVIGTIASFNKGMSGGGYGPLVMGGQVLSGIGVKNAVGITSLSEGLTCLVGVVLYATIKSDVDWTLAPWLMAGAILSVPLAAHTLRRIPERGARLAVSLVVMFLGGLALGKVLL